MSVTCHFNGRLGNILFNMAQVIAYCKKHNLQWWFPENAWACTGGRVPIQVHNTGTKPLSPTVYKEPLEGKSPYYHDVPVMDNVIFHGYYQSFKYFDDYRDEVLNAIQIPYNGATPIVSVHVRRGDCVNQPEGFPMAPIEYYKAAIDYMKSKGYNQFIIFSDDIEWCRGQFIDSIFPECIFYFREGYNEVQDFIAMSSCEHNITARSTFSLMASWFNKNPDKIVLCPSIEQHYWWIGQNKNLLDTNFLKQINW